MDKVCVNLLMSSAEDQEEYPDTLDCKKSIEKLIKNIHIQDSSRNNPEKQHKFWNTQPVPQSIKELKGNTSIEPEKLVDDISSQPLSLPESYYWSLVDVNDPSQLSELYNLLTYHYVEDNDSMFRFDYQGDFLKWALLPPGWKKEWHVGVRVETKDSNQSKLVAFISATPVTLSIQDTKKSMVQVNFLCIHKKLRNKRLSPVLIKEITRRVNLHGQMFQAVYTAGTALPHPISTCRYYHRQLDIAKLVKCRFSSVPLNSSLSKMIKLLKIKENLCIESLEPMSEDDLDDVLQLLNSDLNKWTKFHPIFSKEELKHYFIPRDRVVYSYITRDSNTGRIDSFISFYELPSSVLNHPSISTLKVAYLYYYAVPNQHRLITIMRTLLLKAKNSGFDVFNCLDTYRNQEFIKMLQFGIGDGQLRYYLFNWATDPLLPDQIGLCML